MRPRRSWRRGDAHKARQLTQWQRVDFCPFRRLEIATSGSKGTHQENLARRDNLNAPDACDARAGLTSARVACSLSTYAERLLGWAPNLTGVKVDQICSRLDSFCPREEKDEKSWLARRQLSGRSQVGPSCGFLTLEPAAGLRAAWAWRARVENKSSSRTKLLAGRSAGSLLALCSLGTIKHAAR